MWQNKKTYLLLLNDVYNGHKSGSHKTGSKDGQVTINAAKLSKLIAYVNLCPKRLAKVCRTLYHSIKKNYRKKKKKTKRCLLKSNLLIFQVSTKQMLLSLYLSDRTTLTNCLCVCCCVNVVITLCMFQTTSSIQELCVKCKGEGMADIIEPFFACSIEVLLHTDSAQLLHVVTSSLQCYTDHCHGTEVSALAAVVVEAVVDHSYSRAGASEAIKQLRAALFLQGNGATSAAVIQLLAKYNIRFECV
jgi:hypothetical protein